MLQLDKSRPGGRLRFAEGVFMQETIQSLLDAFPEGVVQIRGGSVLAANAKARRYLPQLVPGGPVPDFLPLPGEGEAGRGSFAAGSASYTFSCASSGTDQVVLFRPDSPVGLEDWQLDGALRQLRSLLGDILAEVGPATEGGNLSAAAFSKTFHRLFRLTENLEFMRQAAGEEGVPFHPVTMDLAGLCRGTVRDAGDLLGEAGVALEYRCKEKGLLIPGDPRLLRKLLLGLISNAARAAGEGTVSLTLRRGGNRAIILVSDSGPALSPRQLAALLREGPGETPLPGQGAGLGLTIARHIAVLHGGQLLVQGGDRSPSVLVALPTGPLNDRTSVRTPMAQWDGGLDPVLMELSDLLPARLFGLEGLD